MKWSMAFLATCFAIASGQALRASYSSAIGGDEAGLSKKKIQQDKDGSILDIDQAGVNKQKQHQIQLQQEREERSRKARLAKLRATQLAKQKAFEAKRKADEKALRKLEAIKKDREDEQRREREKAARQEEEMRQAASESQRRQYEAELARQEHRKSIARVLERISLIGFADGKALLQFSDDNNHAIPLAPGECYRGISVQKIYQNGVRVGVEGEEFGVYSDQKKLHLWTFERFLCDLQGRLKREPYYGYYFGTVAFTIDRNGQPTDASTQDDKRICNIVEAAGPYPRLPLIKLIRVQAVLSHRRCPPTLKILWIAADLCRKGTDDY